MDEDYSVMIKALQGSSRKPYVRNFINLPDGIVSHELVTRAWCWDEITSN